jgi:hypothetical protein
MSAILPHPYIYKHSVKVSDGKNEYTVADLLVMSDGDFNSFYNRFNSFVGDRYETINQHASHTAFIMVEISFITSVVERVVLERRIAKVEKLISARSSNTMQRFYDS